jgi:ABC-type multidrug transport system fused ATPase/permease subunit
VAIVGRNGAGKSTLMDLLLRFYDPTSGQIVVGGTDLRGWDIDVWRGVVGVMTQEVFLFHATVAENIAYGRPTATPAEIEASALEAGLSELLRRLPAGLETVVGDRGSRLSGGERQRIALARLFLRNPSLLILDEHTAHLDGEALREVTKIVGRLSLGRTTFLITHRPEIISVARRVILLDGGRVVADGTHDALLANQPLYASLLASWARDRTQRKRPPGIIAGAGVA